MLTKRSDATDLDLEETRRTLEGRQDAPSPMLRGLAMLELCHPHGSSRLKGVG